MSVTTVGNGLDTVTVQGAPLVRNVMAAFFDLTKPEAGTVGSHWQVDALTESPRVHASVVTPVAGEYGEPWLTNDDRRRMVSLRTGVALDVDRDRRVVRIVGADDAAVAVEAYRVVRQILVRGLTARGAQCLHASAIRLSSGNITLFIGRKGAGKTTAALQSLAADPSRAFVGNDAVLVYRSSAGVSVFGWPTAALVGLGTLRATVGLGSLHGMQERYSDITDVLLDHPPTPDALVTTLQQLSHDVAAAHKVYLLPGQIADLTGTLIASGGPIRRVVGPRLDPSYRGMHPDEDPQDLPSLLRQETQSLPSTFPDLLNLGGASGTIGTLTPGPADWDSIEYESRTGDIVGDLAG